MYSSSPIIQFFQQGGIRINRSGIYNRRSRMLPEGCPEWANPQEQRDWCEQGIVIWDDTQKRIEHIPTENVIEVLEGMRTTNEWRTIGVSMPTGMFIAKDTLPEQKAPKKKGKGDGVSSATEMATAKFDRAFVNMSPGMSQELFVFLETHEPLIRDLAAEENEESVLALTQLASLLSDVAVSGQFRSLDLSQRPLKWVRDEEHAQLICDMSPKRGGVVNERRLFWRGYVERPGHVKTRSPFLNKIEEAVEWVEQELQKPDEDLKSRPAAITLPLRTKSDLGIYWIEPAILEPDRLTYNVMIQIDVAPISSKTMELSFGERYSYDEQYPTPDKLASMLQLDTYQLHVQSIYCEMFRVTSLVTYYDINTANHKAQEIWDRSQIVAHYQTKKVIRARYGYQEHETGYTIYLGACEPDEQRWTRGDTREEFMAKKAMRESLAYALDVDGFRALLGLSKEDISDMDLLIQLHKQRAKSRCIPDTAKLESVHWLVDHGHDQD